MEKSKKRGKREKPKCKIKKLWKNIEKKCEMEIHSSGKQEENIAEKKNNKNNNKMENNIMRRKRQKTEGKKLRYQKGKAWWPYTKRAKQANKDG